MELQRFPLKIRNCELSRVQKAKFLGVIVDEKLKFKDPVNCIQKNIPIHWSYLSNQGLFSDWYTHKTLLCNDLPTHNLCGDCVGCFKLNK